MKRRSIACYSKYTGRRKNVQFMKRHCLVYWRCTGF